MKALRERKAALQSKISEKDAAALIELQDVLKGKKLSVFGELDEASADEIQKIFNIKSKEEVEEILRKTARYQQAAQRLTDDNTKILDSFHTKRLENIQRALKQNVDGFLNFKREVPDRNIDRVIQNVYNRKKPNPGQDYEDHHHELDEFTSYMLTDPIDDPRDPAVVAGEAHDDSLADMKLQLLKAINDRKGKILKVALNIFNKVQDQNLKIVKLDSVRSSSENEQVKPEEVSETLQKYTILLSDPRSPIFSAIESLAQYKGDKGVPGYGKIFRDLDDILTNRIDIEGLEREQKSLETLANEV